VICVKERGIDRPAFGHNESLGEDLQRPDKSDDQVEENVGSQQWQRDVSKALPCAGAIERSRFVVGAADSL